MSHLDVLHTILCHPQVSDVTMYAASSEEGSLDFRAHLFLIDGSTINVAAPNVAELLAQATRRVLEHFAVN